MNMVAQHIIYVWELKPRDWSDTFSSTNETNISSLYIINTNDIIFMQNDLVKIIILHDKFKANDFSRNVNQFQLVWTK